MARVAQNFLWFFAGRISINSFSASPPEFWTSSVSSIVAARRFALGVCSFWAGL